MFWLYSYFLILDGCLVFVLFLITFLFSVMLLYGTVRVGLFTEDCSPVSFIMPSRLNDKGLIVLDLSVGQSANYNFRST